MRSSVSINILNTNEAHFLPSCLDACLAQTYEHCEILVIDNASKDGSRELLQSRYPEVKTLFLDKNRWFCGGHNDGIKHTDTDYVLLLNVDCFLEPTFVTEMVERLDTDPLAGAVQGKILQYKRNNPGWRVIDTVGVKMTEARRNFDRGQGQADVGQFDDMDVIFGADGVAPLYRRSALEDIAIHGEYLDEDFLIYREVVDLSWRFWRRGWKTLFAKNAIGRHVRGFSPKTRNQMSEFVRQLSYRNRLLTLVKNDDASTWLRHAHKAGTFDVAMLGHIVLRERHLFKAMQQFRELLPNARRKRKIIQSNATVPNADVVAMFDRR